MINFLTFLSYFYLLLISVVGYGFLFQKFIFNKSMKLEDNGLIYIGFYGLFTITFISLFTIIFIPHNFFHNMFLHICGILFFITIQVKEKKKYIKFIFLISLFVLSALFISKTHDDFSYYHLPITKYLTEHKIIFGTSNLSHGYKLLSSLFVLNSTFYLPVIKFYSFHFTLIYFLIFFNYFILKEIFTKKIHEVTKYLYLLSFLFFNLSFNRLAEYGTDKVGQLLIVILFIKIFQIICLEEKKNNFLNIICLVPLFGLCITLKTYFLPYLLVGIMIFFTKENFKNVLKFFIFSKSFFTFISVIILYLFFNFVSTGCLLSPLPFSCFGDSLEWAYGTEHFKNLSIWLEQWAKAGAGPNFRVDNPKEYIQNFNWIPRWLEFYFFGKFKDQILLFLTSFLIILFYFKNLNNHQKNFLNKKISIFYLIILIIFSIWFIKHPQLRYGGYSIIFFFFAIPLMVYIHKFEDKILFNKRFNYIILITILIFNLKNFNRIHKEFERPDYYKFLNFPYFAIPKIIFTSETTESGLVIYKTKGHCWDVPSPCTQRSGKLGLKTKNLNSFHFIIN